MFWEMDVEGHRAALGSISDFLLSVFAFAASRGDGGFQRKEWLDYAGAQDGEWFYELYVRDTKNGQSMREALDELFGMDRRGGKRSMKRSGMIWDSPIFMGRSSLFGRLIFRQRNGR